MEKFLQLLTAVHLSKLVSIAQNLAKTCFRRFPKFHFLAPRQSNLFVKIEMLSQEDAYDRCETWSKRVADNYQRFVFQKLW